MNKVLFIHRSVGHNLIKQGNLRELLEAKGIALDDYDNNSGILTQDDANILNNTITIPGNNTNPDNLEKFFSEWPDILNSYDLIMIKSCYPNSHIRNESQLSQVMGHYSSILKSFNYHKKRLLILTTPPLRPLLTNRKEAHLSSELADWLVLESSADIKIFDLHRLLAETDGRHVGMLKQDFRRLIPFDNHPNRKANRTIALKLAEFIELN